MVNQNRGTDSEEAKALKKQVFSKARRGRGKVKSDSATHEAIRQLVAMRANARTKEQEADDGNQHRGD